MDNRAGQAAARAILVLATIAGITAFLAPAPASAAPATSTTSAASTATKVIVGSQPAGLTGIPRPGATALATGGFQIHNANPNSPGKCIGISGNLAGDWNCTTNPDQTWHWGSAIASGWYQLVNGKGQCLAVNGASDSAGARILGWSCVGSADQYWALFDNGDGTARIVNYHGWFDPTATAWVVGVWGGDNVTDNGAPSSSGGTTEHATRTGPEQQCRRGARSSVTT
jgi:hypothetical protein